MGDTDMMFNIMMWLVVLGAPILVIIIIAGCIKRRWHFNPFSYPRVTVKFDISRKRQPVYDNYIDEWIIEMLDDKHCSRHQTMMDMQQSALDAWIAQCLQTIKGCTFWKKHRTEQYEAMKAVVVCNNYKMFEFVFARDQTRYSQSNYQKTAYVVSNIVDTVSLSLDDLFEIDDELMSIDYETTREKWNMKNQRKLVTKELRDKIKKRDNYTCQVCGKYMPDEVGLHVDHIVPVKKGGKSVESNLQVLCDKCNYRKGSKLV